MGIEDKNGTTKVADITCEECTQCENCLDACPFDDIIYFDDGHNCYLVQEDWCAGVSCDKDCVAVCPAGAIEMVDYSPNN